MRKSPAVALFLLSSFAGLAHAQTATSTIAVAATVIKGCLVVATPLVFGNYSATGGSPVQINATITVTCTVGTTYTVGLDAGTATGATTSTRGMTFSGHVLNYAIYSNAAFSLNWGNIPGTDTDAGTGTGLPQILTAYGQISTGQSVPTGAYTDSVTVSVVY